MIIIRRLLTKTVAVDLNPATRKVVTGTEAYAREVGSRLEAAAPELHWRFFASRARAGLGVDMMVAPFPRLWSQVRLPLALIREHADLLFVPSHVVPFTWPGRALTAVHDLAFERHPTAYSAPERAYLQLTTRWAALRCPLLIADSESTKPDLVALYRLRPERIRVVPLGGGEPARRPIAPASRPGAPRRSGLSGPHGARFRTAQHQGRHRAAATALLTQSTALPPSSPFSPPGLAEMCTGGADTRRSARGDRCGFRGARGESSWIHVAVSGNSVLCSE